MDSTPRMSARRPVVAQVETELADGTMGWAEMRGGQSAWAAAGSFLDRTGRGRVGEDWGQRRASLAGSLTEAWTAATSVGDGSYGSVSGTVEVAGESFAYAGTLPEGAPWVACVQTTPDAADRRRWVRETLGRHMPVVFLVGRGGETLGEEDVLFVDVEERYSNPRSSLGVKVFACLKAVTRHRPETRFVLKVCDDVELDVAALQLDAERVTSPAYVGRRLIFESVHRDPLNKSYISRVDFPRDRFPPFMQGHAFVLDAPAASAMVDAVANDLVLLQDDYWIGIIAERVGIPAVPSTFEMLGDRGPPFFSGSGGHVGPVSARVRVPPGLNGVLASFNHMPVDSGRRFGPNQRCDSLRSYLEADSTVWELEPGVPADEDEGGQTNAAWLVAQRKGESAWDVAGAFFEQLPGLTPFCNSVLRRDKLVAALKLAGGA